MSEEVKPHPAKFSLSVLEEIDAFLAKDHVPWSSLVKTLYDPFAGIGKVFELARPNLLVTATEIEQEWADQCKQLGMHCMDAFEFMSRDGMKGWFDYIVTSPTYGNRMADHHVAKDKSKRHTYKHYLGRDLSKNNSGAMQWGDEYRDFHRRAWKMAYQVTRPGGKIIVNVKDHIRKGARQLVVDFHIGALQEAGYIIVGCEKVGTPGMKHGENGEVRVDGEWIVIGMK